MEDNPAARLHSLLDEALKMRGKNKVWHVWAGLLGVDTNDFGTAVGEIAKVYALPAQIRHEIAQLSGDPDTYLEHFDNIESQLFTVPLQNNWSSVVSNLKTEAMFGLKVCAERLHNERPQRTLGDEQLTEIEERTHSLFEFVDGADLPDELRQFILRHLHAVEVALRRVRISGLDDLNAAFLQAVGEWAVRPDLAEAVADTKDGKRITGYLRDVMVWIGVINATPELTEKAQAALALAKGIAGELTAGG